MELEARLQVTNYGLIGFAWPLMTTGSVLPINRRQGGKA